MPVCNLIFCDKEANLRCSKCKAARYCSREHQVDDWSTHKIVCSKPILSEPIQNKTIETSSAVPNDSEEYRVCRCMFCGEELKLGSEAEAVDHMKICSSLQEQFAGKEQFTIPSVLRNKIHNIQSEGT